MIRRPQTVAFWRGKLPHWEVTDGRYFVTLHLAGAIPQQGQDRIHEMSAQLERLAETDFEGKLRLQRQIFAEIEAWLDRAADVAHLKDPRIADMITEAITFREGRDWHMFEYVIMPNHVHLFFEIDENAPPHPGQEGRLKGIMEQFKRWTGHKASEILDLTDGRFWQDEWFDHWSRSDPEDERIMAYIRRNPEKAGLVEDYLQYPYGSWVTK